MNGLYYLLLANMYISILYLFYRVLLKQETFYHLNRWYLIGILLISFSLPLISVQNNSIKTNGTSLNRINASVRPPNKSKEVAYHPLPIEKVPGRISILESVKSVALALYGIGVIICMYKLLLSIRIVITLFKHSSRYKEDGVVHVLLKDQQETFSFFNWLFYNPEFQPDKAVIRHEMVHIRQKHSVDVLLFELCKAFNWFNPLVYLLCKDVKLNHEFLADKATCQTTTNKYAYALLLIGHTEKNPALPLTSAIFRKEQLKQRLINLKKSRSANRQLIKYVLPLPMLILVYTITAFALPKDYGLITLKLPSRQLVLSYKIAVFYQVNHPAPNFHLKSGKALSLVHHQDTGRNSLKEQRKAVNGITMNALALKKRPDSASVVMRPIQNDQKQQLITVNRSKTDTASLIAVKTAYKNGQVSINRSPADTLHQYVVEPVYKDGQVSINKRKIDP